MAEIFKETYPIQVDELQYIKSKAKINQTSFDDAVHTTLGMVMVYYIQIECDQNTATNIVSQLNAQAKPNRDRWFVSD